MHVSSYTLVLLLRVKMSMVLLGRKKGRKKEREKKQLGPKTVRHLTCTTTLY